MRGTLHVFAHVEWTTILSSATPNHVKPWRLLKLEPRNLTKVPHLNLQIIH